MTRLSLFDFQQEASSRLLTAALTYFENGQDRMGGRGVPFVGQLKAVTGAGKTPILADVIGKLKPSIILWTTKFGTVVDQTVSNLSLGGKYNHLLGLDVDVIKLSEISSAERWQRILEAESGVTILVSTVAAWNSSEKDDRLNVHRINDDWGDKSRWEQLKSLRQRPLYVVYDEAHNSTPEQVELLDDLDPAGFFIASASVIRGKLQSYLTLLPEEMRRQRIVSVSTVDVVDAQLLKSTISLADYDSSVEEMLADVVERRRYLEQKFKNSGVSIIPKAIYVVESSNSSAKGQDARPIAIWKLLTSRFGISSDSIAVCTNTKQLPDGVIRVDSIDKLSEQFTHVIFNKKLQEGWDDPTVYVCYFDGKTDSATRIQQIIGRALRQPQATHYQDDELNTAYFFVNCPTDTLERIVDQLKEELRIYSEGAPDDFEPFQFKEERKALPRVPIKPEYEGLLRIPLLKLEMPPGDRLISLIKRKTYGFDEQDLAAPGRALINVVSVRTGETQQRVRDLLEDMKVRCGTYLQDQIRSKSKNCSDSIPPATFTTAELNKLACYKSKALNHYLGLAGEVVMEYENHVRLVPDPVDPDYLVGDYQPTGSIRRDFSHSAHPYYDSKVFNGDELEMAKALDKLGYVWIRNKDRVNYGIPLPIKSGSSSTFYPDFIWWVKDTIWALDPTGKHILLEKVRTKLLMTPAPLKIALISRGKLDENYRPKLNEGWSLLRQRSGLSTPEPFDSLEEMLAILVQES